MNGIHPLKKPKLVILSVFGSLSNSIVTGKELINMENKELQVAHKVLNHFSSPETSVQGGVSFALIHKGQTFEQVDKYQGHACFGPLLYERHKNIKYFVFWNFILLFIKQDS